MGTLTHTGIGTNWQQAGAQELIECAMGADRDAACELVRRYERLVWSVVRTSGVTGAAAEDVSQTVWATFFSKLHTIRNAEAVGGWLATVARNAAMAQLRTASRERPVETHHLDGTFEVDMTEALELEEDTGRLVRAFAELPEDAQELLRLVASDLSYREISEITGRPVGAIGPTRMRALEKLRSLYFDDAVAV